ncbi:DUF3800 domain-containing protein [Loktanella sp. IMCC34160]|uniref:DUF3800 domain-containing protein n=1 Tax=Loktanella sp. IMCC34160 TaxID=2510646 RepID=UPI0013ED2F22|nr:DUF3800 domain-containing protein [Loktanella sp. IMCC34160]
MSVSVFIDESGEAGISKVRTDISPGASPYFVLAAAVMPNAVTINAKSVLAEVEAKIGKHSDHATDLGHSQTVYWSRKAAGINLRFFAVVSNKSTLGEYSERIRNDPDKFYNKCAVYLLERVGKYLLSKDLGSTEPRVVFESRNHDYDAMRRYIGKIKDNPMHSDARYLRVFNPFAITALAKPQEPLLKFADLAAHAVYQCSNKTRSNFFIPEPRYLEELSKRFGADERGRIIGNGLKCIHSLEQLDLDKDVEERIRRMRAFPMRKSA